MFLIKGNAMVFTVVILLGGTKVLHKEPKVKFWAILRVSCSKKGEPRAIKNEV